MGDSGCLPRLTPTETQVLITLVSRCNNLSDDIKRLKILKPKLDEQNNDQNLSDENWERLSGGFQTTGSLLTLISWGIGLFQGFGYGKQIPGNAVKYLGYTGGGLKMVGSISEFTRDIWRKEWRKDLSDFMDVLRSFEINLEKFSSLRKQFRLILEQRAGSRQDDDIRSFLRYHLGLEGDANNDHWVSQLIFDDPPAFPNEYKQTSDSPDDLKDLLRKFTDIPNAASIGQSLKDGDFSAKTKIKGLLGACVEIYDFFEGLDKLGFKIELFKKMKSNVDTFKTISNILMFFVDDPINMAELVKKYGEKLI